MKFDTVVCAFLLLLGFTPVGGVWQTSARDLFQIWRDEARTPIPPSNDTQVTVSPLRGHVFPSKLEQELDDILPRDVHVHHMTPESDDDGYIVVLPSEHEIARHLVCPAALILMVVFVILVKMEVWEVSYIPESLVIIIFGIFVGYASVYFDVTWGDDEARTKFSANLLNLVLLPVIIFETGWSIRVKDFATQFVYILIFAIPGTVINTSVVAYLIHYTGSVLGWHSITGVRTALAFSSLICATDPVATLATYSKLRVDPLLNIMVLGEAVINDAVAIVLFKMFNSDDVMGIPGAPLPSTHDMFMRIGWSVTVNFLGSSVLGCVLGVVFVYVMRVIDMGDSPKVAALYIVVSGYAAFSIAEGYFHMSGIIVTLFCSTVMGIYAKPHLHLSQQGMSGTKMTTYFIQQVASLADSAVFLLVGFSFVHIKGPGLRFATSLIPICLLGRAASTFPLGLLVNGVKKVTMGSATQTNRLEAKHMFMMWHGGLRGAIALVLAMELGPWVDVLDGKGTAKILHTATFMVIVVLLGVFGGSTQFFLNLFKIPVGVDAAEDHLCRKDKSRTMTAIDFFDKNFLNPLLKSKSDMEAPVEEETEVPASGVGSVQ